MAGCILIGKHAVTFEHNRKVNKPELTIKTSDVEIGFYLDPHGNLEVTFQSDLTIGADLMRVIPVPKDGD